jgi:hypothetical protein
MLFETGIGWSKRHGISVAKEIRDRLPDNYFTTSLIMRHRLLALSVFMTIEAK